MNTENLRQIFKSPFDYKTYSNEIVHRLFGCNDVVSRPELLDTNAEGDQSFFIGQMDDADHRLLGFFYTRVADGGDVRRKRVGLRKLISPYLKYDVDGAIAVFDDGRHWRLSYICDLKEGSTSAKRFSYILGDENGQYKTPLERLEKVAKLNGRLKLSDLKESFSVDALSDEFFDEYHIHYDRIVAELARQGKTGAIHHDYVKKMMGRIVFLHFLQKKGWLNGNPTFLRDLFYHSPHQADFLEQVLEPLFFGIFNTESEQRKKLFANEHWSMDLLKQWEHLPYLNGGLFERDEVDKMNIRLPASLFNDLFTFLASYNFTVDENDPDDAEIGVDPEMLGKIFESLLEDNKSKGAFYTPKEIVRYMCKESLIAYLSEQLSVNSEQNNNTKIPTDIDSQITDHSSLITKIRTFVETHEFPGELEPYREILDRALREVKICDPAIGSGAFPMGLLNELWRCREALTDHDSCSLIIVHRSQLKKEIIENNIYGVDIERGAIDIARLRFWLSIVVDSEEPQALPNFDYKFMQGNSLIESFEGVDLSRMMSNGSQLSRLGKGRNKAGENQFGFEFATDDTKRNLQMLLKEYFSITDHVKKAEMRQSINDSVKSYIRHQDLRPEAVARLTSLDPSANQEFFLWHTWFKDIFDKGGFDIVVGNPPYLFLSGKGSPVQKLRKEGKHEESIQLEKTLNQYAMLYPTVSKGCRDYYKWFYKLAINICRTNGVVAYITPDTYFNMPKYQDLRRELLSNTVKILVDLGFSVFDTPTVSSSVIVLVKDSLCCERTIVSDIKHVLNRCNRSNLEKIIVEFKKVVHISNFEICAYKNKLTEEIYNTGTNTTLNFYLDITEGEHNIQIDHPLSYQSNGSVPVLIDSEMKRNTFVRRGYVMSDLPYSTLHSGERCLLRKTGDSIVAAIPENTDYAIAHQNVYVVKSHSNFFSIKFWLGILNSKLLTFLYQNGLYGQKGRTLAQFRIYALNALPIPRSVEDFDQAAIVSLIDKILISNKVGDKSETIRLESEIDQLVYTLYGLTEEEVKVVEGKEV